MCACGAVGMKAVCIPVWLSRAPLPPPTSFPPCPLTLRSSVLPHWCHCVPVSAAGVRPCAVHPVCAPGGPGGQPEQRHGGGPGGCAVLPAQPANAGGAEVWPAVGRWGSLLCVRGGGGGEGLGPSPAHPTYVHPRLSAGCQECSEHSLMRMSRAMHTYSGFFWSVGACAGRARSRVVLTV